MQFSDLVLPMLFSGVLLQLAPSQAAAEADGETLLSYVEALCGAELTAYEETVPAGKSVWQSRVGNKSLGTSQEATNRIGAWLSSAFPVIDAVVLASSRLTPEQRTDVASQLGRALNLTRCLQPSLAQLDAYKKDARADAETEITSFECILKGASIVHDAMLSAMADDELRTLASGQLKMLAASACEVVQ